jgi:hypothetical protein
LFKEYGIGNWWIIQLFNDGPFGTVIMINEIFVLIPEEYALSFASSDPDRNKPGTVSKGNGSLLDPVFVRF